MYTKRIEYIYKD